MLSLQAKPLMLDYTHSPVPCSPSVAFNSPAKHEPLFPSQHDTMFLPKMDPTTGHIGYKPGFYDLFSSKIVTDTLVFDA
jgi:hypothetical protein